MKSKRKNVIGKTVRRLRESARLSVEKLAELTHGRFTPGQIGQIESGKRRVLDGEVPILAGSLGVVLEALFPKRRK